MSPAARAALASVIVAVGAAARRRMKATVLRIMPANTPESGKRGLLKPPSKRAQRFFRMLNRRRTTLALCQESGKHAASQARRRKWWRQVPGTPNSRAWGNVQRNTIFVKHSQARVIDRDQIPVGHLYAPVALLQHRRTGFTWVAISGHVPTAHSSAAHLRPVYVPALKDYLDTIPGVPVIIGADTNSGAGWANPLRPRMQVAHRRGVDILLASRHFETTRRWTLHRPRLSDHAFLEARLRVAMPGRQISRLPKRK